MLIKEKNQTIVIDAEFEKIVFSLGNWSNKKLSKIEEEKSKNKAVEKYLRILIVDDEAITRVTFADILKEKKYKVDTAKDGYEAVRKAKETIFDIAFIDIKLDHLDGVETFEMIKKISSGTVAVMMTAYSVEDLVQKALAKGAYGCLYKPFDMDEVIKLIKDIERKKLK